MRLFPFITAMVCALGFLTASTSADVIHLKDGTSVQGKVRCGDDGWIVQNNGKATHISGEQVDSIELGPATAPVASVAQDHLVSLRRSVENLSDLDDIITRYQRFIEWNADSAVAASARTDLASWQDRQRRNLVKVGTKWVSADDREKMVAQAAVSAATARQLMKQGRTREAEPLLVDCVSIDAQNAAAWYLIGLLRYQQEQLTPARKAFEMVASLVPDHAATLNNLAVIHWRQHQYTPALIHFDAAMLAAPVNKMVLDNVFIAFETLPAEFQKSPVAEKALRHFNEQDPQLALVMSKQGLHRYGSLWVTDQDVLRMQRQEKDITAALDQLAGDFQRTRDRADQLDSDIAANRAQMRRVEAGSYISDPRTGAEVSVVYPSSYYELSRDTEKMIRDRDATIAKLDAIKKQAVDLQSNRPSIKIQGVQLMFFAEDAPLRVQPLPPAAATQAALR